MKTFYLMMGLPGSGKSTYINSLPASTALISTDRKRFELFGSEEDQSDNKRVFAECTKDLERAFSKSVQTVAFDATNFQKRFRKPFLDLAKRFGYKTIIVFCDTDLETCIARQQTRSRKVDPAVICNFAARLEAPTPDEADQVVVIKQG